MSTDKTAIATENDVAELKGRIERRLAEIGKTARGVSREAGLTVGYLGEIMNGRSKNPRYDGLKKIADILGWEVADLTPDGNGHARSSNAQSSGMVTNSQRFIPQGNTPVVPLYAVKTVLDEILLPLIADPVGLVPTLPALSLITNAYAFTVPNDMNAPRYMAGETVYISPVAVPKPGDFVFLKTGDGRAGIAQIVRIRDSRITTRVLNGAGKNASDKTRDRSDYTCIHRIVGSVG